MKPHSILDDYHAGEHVVNEEKCDEQERKK